MAGGRIELVALTKRFTDIAVDRIDLTVDSGEFFSLLGAVRDVPGRRGGGRAPGLLS